MTPRLLETAEEARRLYPPRAEHKIRPNQLSQFRGYLAQYKYNDIRVLIHIDPGGEIELLTRKREPVREYRLTPRMKIALESLHLDHSKHHVLDGGVMRHLTVRGESPVILWDILVQNDLYLIGTSYWFRYERLRVAGGDPRGFEKTTGHEIGLVVQDGLWIAPLLAEPLSERFQSIVDLDYMEGIILKNPNSRLEPGIREDNNTSWQIKVRKPHTSYMF